MVFEIFAKDEQLFIIDTSKKIFFFSEVALIKF